MLWWAIVLGAAGCYLAKWAGLSVPARVLENARVRAVAALVPVALLSALLVIQTFSVEHRIGIDERSAGIAVAAVALACRAPLLLVVALAATTTALLRAIG